MALSRSTYSVPGTPRVYIDNLLYGRAVGVVFGEPSFLVHRITPEGGAGYVNLASYVDTKLFWDLDPLRYVTINFSDFADEGDLNWIITSPGGYDSEIFPGFRDLMGTSNYFAALNHNLNSGSPEPLQFGSNSVDSHASIVYDLDEDVISDGFMISEITPGENYDSDGNLSYSTSAFINPSGEADINPDTVLKIGSFSVGTYLDFPNSPDLSVKQSISYDGVSTTRTLAGKDLTNIRYSGAPNWGNLPPFTNTEANTYNYKGVSFTGRRSWDMKFSYVDKTDMFNSIMSGSSAGTNFRILSVGDNDIEDGFKADESIVGTYLSRTLGGSLKHILQPNNTKDEFYFVKLDQNSISINQVAHGVFDISLKFVQVW